MSTETQRFRKPNSLIVMASKRGKLTLKGRKLLNVLIKITADAVAEKIRNGEPVLATVMYEAPIVELARKCNVDGEEQTTLIKKLFLEMRSITMDFSKPDAAQPVVMHDLNILSEAKIEIRGGINMGMWAFPPKIMTVFVESDQRYTWIDIHQMNKMNSYAALALLEICLRYKDNPSKLTSKQPVEWWMDALSGSKYKEGEEKKERKWRQFKHEYVKPAIININNDTLLTIELIEEKVGKTITHAQFAIKEVRRPPKEGSGIGIELASHAAQLDLDFNALRRAQSAGVTDEIIKISLHKLGGRLSNTELEPVANKSAFFGAIVKDTLISVDQSEKPVPNGAKKNERNTLKSEADNKIEIKAKTVYDEVKEELANLDEERLAQVKLLAINSIKSRGMFSGKTKANIEEDNWENGLLESFLLDVVGRELFGEDWQKKEKIDQKL